MKKREYFVGLDIGTNSVGWAVTNDNYSVLRANNKWLHGVRMFEAMSTAEERRNFRSSRRRLKRRKDRLNQLKGYFFDEVTSIDGDFFIRLNEGFLQEFDRSVDRNFTLFDDLKFNDINYYQKFPTIYHLREHLMNSNEKEDIRLIYLAVHHILKYRGHFLFSGGLNQEGNIEEMIQDLLSISENLFSFEVYNLKDQKYQNSFLDILIDKKYNKRDKNRELKLFLNENIPKEMKQFDEISKLLAGSVTNINKLFIDLELEEEIKISFDSNNIDEKMEELKLLGDEEFKLIETCKKIYDYTILQNILKDRKSISEAMVISYQKHKKELQKLKKIVKSINNKEYKAMFKDKTLKNNYVAYVEKGYQTRENFYRNFRKVLEKVNKKYNKEVIDILFEIDNNNYLLKQRIPSNGVIPHQIHLYELEKILNNASQHYDFLNIKNEYNLSVSQQILEIFKFRIPYYIGPLNDFHKDKENGFAWVVRKDSGKVYPWNFTDKIDAEKTAEAFIRRMTNKCTYILEEDVLPKSSLLYQKFLVLNEINNIKINGEGISVDLKQKLFNDLFVSKNINVSKKVISNYLKSNYQQYFDQDIEITGVDDILKSRLTSYHSITKILSEEFDEKMVEDIILWSTLFSDEKSMLIRKINAEYGKRISEKQISQISTINFTGWGRISKKMLEELLDKNIGSEPLSIILAMYETNNNLMELLSSQYTFLKQIESINEHKLESDFKVNYSMLDSLNLPPNIKRPVWQTIRIMEELKRVMNNEPKRIFIEMAREHQNTGRIDSRKKQLIELYMSLDNEPELLDSLSNETNDRLRKRKIFLYYKQLGKCMYTQKSIIFEDLLDDNKYDIDHIYPRSITADDSLNNLVLVTKKANQEKSDNYPLSPKVRKNMFAYWTLLMKNGLLEKEKYFRLTRTSELTIDELSNFVARQLVETRQSTKAVLNVLKQIYPNTEVITIKAGHIDKFRQENKIIKTRSLNDLHHAKDAYLAAVVGNVYFERFTSDPRNYIKNARKRDYNLVNILDTKNKDRNIIARHSGLIVWESGPEGSIKKVKDVLKNNDILTTYMIFNRRGGLFDQNIVSKAKNKIRIKYNLPSENYGGFNKATYHHLCLIERDQGRKRIRQLVPMPLMFEKQFEDKKFKINYLTNILKFKNVEIMLDNIPSTNTLLEYEGGRNRITGVTGNSFVVRNEHQPYLKESLVPTWKLIENFKTNQKDYLLDRIEIGKLKEIYNEILKKMEFSIYKVRLEKFRLMAVEFKENLNKIDKKEFINLIWELYKLLKSTRESSNLKLIGGSPSSGINTVGQNISTKEDIYLINQSVTGLFETKINLLKL